MNELSSLEGAFIFIIAEDKSIVMISSLPMNLTNFDIRIRFDYKLKNSFR